MSGLFSSLSAAARALDAQRFGLDTVGENLANINTPGYTRRALDLVEVPAADNLTGGGGVAVQGVRSLRDSFVEQRLWREQPLAQQQSATAELLGIVQGAIGRPGEGLDADLGAFFDAWAQLADNPTSTSARQQLLSRADLLAGSFHQVSDQLGAVQRDADRQLRASIADINAYAAQIATLNGALVSVGGSGTAQGLTVVDEIHEAVNNLSGLIDLTVVERADGGLDASVQGGRALVMGTNSYALSTSSVGPNGYAAIKAADGTDLTPALTTGRIGGLLRARDSLVPGYSAQLDTLAAALVQQVNTLHTAGYDLNGAQGGNFFAPIAVVAGAAASVTVASPVGADASKIAAAGSAAPGDNQTARAMSNLRDLRFVGGIATPAEGWAGIVYQVGQDAQLADHTRQTHADIVRQLENLRDAASGISIDDEAAMMLKFQRAYEANARYFQTINSALETLLNLVQRL